MKPRVIKEPKTLDERQIDAYFSLAKAIGRYIGGKYPKDNPRKSYKSPSCDPDYRRGQDYCSRLAEKEMAKAFSKLHLRDKVNIMKPQTASMPEYLNSLDNLRDNLEEYL